MSSKNHQLKLEDMGMPLTKYGMLSALGYGADSHIMQRTENLLEPFKLFGLILHDPQNHQKFHDKFASSFDRLDYLTGQDFLFLGITDPPNGWLERTSRNYFEIWGREDLINPAKSYQTQDESITAYTLAQSLGIDYDDLPVIILTNNFQLNQYQVIRTCEEHLVEQLTEIGFFCTRSDKYFSLINDPNFTELIRKIDLCGGSSNVSAENSLAKTLSDFLAFIVDDYDNFDSRRARVHVRQVINSFFSSRKYNRDPDRLERLNLTLLGYLSNLKDNRSGAFLDSSEFYSLSSPDNEAIYLDDDCEAESKIIINTFNKVYPLFKPLRQKLADYQRAAHNDLPFERYGYDQPKLDYSSLILSLSKVLEIETNLSVVHWVRNSLSIEMPDYYKKYKADNKGYNVLPSASLVLNPQPVDFNMQSKGKWRPPGTGQSKLIVESLSRQNKMPPVMTEVNDMLTQWGTIARFRNPAAHTGLLTSENFNLVYNAFIHLNTTGKFREMNRLKMIYRG